MSSQTRQERRAGNRATARPPPASSSVGQPLPFLLIAGRRELLLLSQASGTAALGVLSLRGAVFVSARGGQRSCLSSGRAPAAPPPARLLGPISAHEHPSPRTLSVKPTCPHCLHLPTKLAPSSPHLSYLPLDFMLLIFFLKMTVNGRIS